MRQGDGFPRAVSEGRGLGTGRITEMEAPAVAEIAGGGAEVEGS